MKIDRDMNIKEHASVEWSTDSDTWAGLYTTVESSEIVIRISSAKNRDSIVYMIGRRKKYRGTDRIRCSDIRGGEFSFTDDEIFGDFIKWFRDNEGYSLYERELDLGPYEDCGFI